MFFSCCFESSFASEAQVVKNVNFTQFYGILLSLTPKNTESRKFSNNLYSAGKIFGEAESSADKFLANVLPNILEVIVSTLFRRYFLKCFNNSESILFIVELILLIVEPWPNG